MNDHLRFGWWHGRPVWTATTEQGIMLIDERTYDRIIREQLAAQGIEWKSWMQYLRPAEDAWHRQCAAIDRLHCDLGLWQSLPGVDVSSRSVDRAP